MIGIDWRLMATIGIPAIVVIAGWFLVHWLTGLRELRERKRDARLKALEAAFMRLATASNRPLTDNLRDDLETFVSEIQLYGTPQQIKLTGDMVHGFMKGGRVPFDPLLEDLRNTIRAELKLEPISGTVWWLRIGRGKDTDQKETNIKSQDRAIDGINGGKIK
jgi:hypothetical protein